jgi:uncharacterized protein DUF2505
MRVAIEHVFEGIGAAAYETLFFDEAFNESLGRHLHMGRMLVRLDRDADRIVRHVRFEPAQDPDSPAKQAFGSSRASFLEELDYDARARRGAWKTVPNLFTDRVKNTGTIEFVDVPGGTKRIVTGDVVVKLFGFGGRVEKMIAAEIVKSYEQTTAFTRAWLAKR